MFYLVWGCSLCHVCERKIPVRVYSLIGIFLYLNKMSIFDQAWAGPVETGISISGIPITLNGLPVMAEVSTITNTSRRMNGLRVVENSSIVHVSRSDFESSSAEKGKKVALGNMTLRIMSVSDLGGAGYELVCEAEEQRTSLPSR